MTEIRESVEDAGELMSKQRDFVAAIHSGACLLGHVLQDKRIYV